MFLILHRHGNTSLPLPKEFDFTAVQIATNRECAGLQELKTQDLIFLSLSSLLLWNQWRTSWMYLFSIGLDCSNDIFTPTFGLLYELQLTLSSIQNILTWIRKKAKFVFILLNPTDTYI